MLISILWNVLCKRQGSYDLEEMPKDLYIQKRKLAKLYVSQRTTVRKMYHMLPYEYWQKEDFDLSMCCVYAEFIYPGINTAFIISYNFFRK